MAGIALAALMVSLPVEAAGAGRVSAAINGRHIRWRGRLVAFNYGPSGLIAVATKPFGRKTIGFGCPIILEGQLFPVTMTVCNANYTKGIGARGKSWQASTGFRVTFDSFDGSIVQGTFSGTLAALFYGDGATITVQGAFRGPIHR